MTKPWCHFDVTSVTWRQFICPVTVSCWQVREYRRKHVQRFRKQLCWFGAPATQYCPRCLFSFLSAILRERLWHQSDVRSWYHVVFWPRDSNTSFEGKNAQIWRFGKSSILSLDFSNFGNVYFSRQTLKLKKNNFWFIGTLKHLDSLPSGLFSLMSVVVTFICRSKQCSCHYWSGLIQNTRNHRRKDEEP